ncbi:hypothetical protein D4768_19325 [Rhodococcus erythropolis]|nr:hypothetical protein D4768_19325 [Rhodococcus erythropolis]
MHRNGATSRTMSRRFRSKLLNISKIRTLDTQSVNAAQFSVLFGNVHSVAYETNGQKVTGR